MGLNHYLISQFSFHLSSWPTKLQVLFLIMDIINSGISTDELSNNFKAEVILALHDSNKVKTWMYLFLLYCLCALTRANFLWINCKHLILNKFKTSKNSNKYYIHEFALFTIMAIFSPASFFFFFTNYNLYWYNFLYPIK